MNVVRIDSASGSSVQPALDPHWSALTQLEWKAAVVAADTGVPIRVFEAEPGDFSLIVGRVSSGADSFDRAWTYLNGVHAGSAATKVILTRTPGETLASANEGAEQ